MCPVSSLRNPIATPARHRGSPPVFLFFLLLCSSFPLPASLLIRHSPTSLDFVLPISGFLDAPAVRPRSRMERVVTQLAWSLSPRED